MLRAKSKHAPGCGLPYRQGEQQQQDRLEPRSSTPLELTLLVPECHGPTGTSSLKHWNHTGTSWTDREGSDSLPPQQQGHIQLPPGGRVCEAVWPGRVRDTRPLGQGISHPALCNQMRVSRCPSCFKQRGIRQKITAGGLQSPCTAAGGMLRGWRHRSPQGAGAELCRPVTPQDLSGPCPPHEMSRLVAREAPVPAQDCNFLLIIRRESTKGPKPNQHSRYKHA